MIIKSIFVPENCLQMEQFPTYLLWDKNTDVSIIITYSSNIELKSVYNVPLDGIQSDNDNSIKLNKFFENGYVSIVFESKKCDESKVIGEIKFEISANGDTEYHNKKIILFRQSIEIMHVPTEIHITYNEISKTFQLSDKIKIKNTGSAIAILNTELISDDTETDSPIKFSPPESLKQYIDSFINSLHTDFMSLIEKYPKYTDEITYVDNLLSLSEKKNMLKQDDDFKSRINEIFTKDMDFSKEFISVFASACLKNMDIITNLETFMEYLKSVDASKIILENSIENMNLEKPLDSEIMKIKINVYDLVHNDYPPIELSSISLYSKTSGSFPLYDLFEFSEYEVSTNLISE